MTPRKMAVKMKAKRCVLLEMDAEVSDQRDRNYV
jgi:hypothetical protein